jgi:hypothetical protein
MTAIRKRVAGTTKLLTLTLVIVIRYMKMKAKPTNPAADTIERCDKFCVISVDMVRDNAVVGRFL